MIEVAPVAKGADRGSTGVLPVFLGGIEVWHSSHHNGRYDHFRSSGVVLAAAPLGIWPAADRLKQGLATAVSSCRYRRAPSRASTGLKFRMMVRFVVKISVHTNIDTARTGTVLLSPCQLCRWSRSGALIVVAAAEAGARNVFQGICGNTALALSGLSVDGLSLMALTAQQGSVKSG